MSESSRPKLIPSAIAIGIGILIWFVIPAPGSVKPEAWHLLALFVATIAAIIGKAMPIGALSIIAISLVAITGVTNPGKPAADSEPEDHCCRASHPQSLQRVRSNSVRL